MYSLYIADTTLSLLMYSLCIAHTSLARSFVGILTLAHSFACGCVRAWVCVGILTRGAQDGSARKNAV